MSGKELKNKQRILVIAEVANAHEGRVEDAQKLITAAAEAKADAVKFQRFSADELLVRNHSRYAHFDKLAMPNSDWMKVRELARKYRLKFFCDVFGFQSFDFVKKLDAGGIKIHSSDLMNLPLLKRISAEWEKDILVACGGASEFEIFQALKTLLNDGNRDRVCLLHGFQNFPTAVEETHLLRIKTLNETFNLPVGFMDHIDAENPLSRTLPLMAIGSGACAVEKHITLDRSKKGIDYYSSLEPAELTALVKEIRRCEGALGSPDIAFCSGELTYRIKMKKHLVTTRSVKKGQVLVEADLDYKRAETQAFPLDIQRALGHKAKVDLGPDTPVTLSHLEAIVGILIIARFNSKRLPGKAVLPILGKPALSYLIERAKLCRTPQKIILCTTINPEDDALEQLARSDGIVCYRGEDSDVIARLLGACQAEGLDVAIRVTGDDIFLSPQHLDDAVKLLLDTNADYSHDKGLISGSECEVFSTQALQLIYDFAEERKNTEYLTYYIENDNFRKVELEVPEDLRRNISLTLN